MKMNINLLIETILLLLAILTSNGFIYSLTIIDWNKTNSSENQFVITNSSEKDVLTPTLLIASKPIEITSSETGVSKNISDSENLIDLETTEGDITQNLNFLDINGENSIVSHINGRTSIVSETNWRITPHDIGIIYNLSTADSDTILTTESLAEWNDLITDLYSLPFGTPTYIYQETKFEELNVLYSQDIINYSVTQSELWDLIEPNTVAQILDPGFNHLILTMMSYLHI
uniref:Uncharacterized protein n=1 Tax=Lactifluus hygrophoroides TaxID=1837245 RepID=A0A2Z4M8Y6_9AGAM|nr:hypothetical protein [Lactifluus hygrophoroides]AWX52956.1 hypothetical protein [Lactifluus hygrophoroides]